MLHAKTPMLKILLLLNNGQYQVLGSNLFIHPFIYFECVVVLPPSVMVFLPEELDTCIGDLCLEKLVFRFSLNQEAL